MMLENESMGDREKGRVDGLHVSLSPVHPISDFFLYDRQW